MVNALILFAEKMWVAFLLQKLLTFLQQKYHCTSDKTVNNFVINELAKLTMLWTIGPRSSHYVNPCINVITTFRCRCDVLCLLGCWSWPFGHRYLHRSYVWVAVILRIYDPSTISLWGMSGWCCVSLYVFVHYCFNGSSILYRVAAVL